MEDCEIKEGNIVDNNKEPTDAPYNNNIMDNIEHQKSTEQKEKESIFNIKYAVPIFALNLTLIIAMAILLITNYTSLKDLNNEIMDLSSEVESMKTSINDIKDIKNDVNFIWDYLDEVQKSSFLTQLSLEVSEGVVTDKVVIQKAILYSTGDILNGYIDIRPQPSYSSYFQGQGKFNLSDRELKAMIEEVIKEFESYISSISLYNIKLEGGSIDITANNYFVAEYTNGKVILAGE